MQPPPQPSIRLKTSYKRVLADTLTPVSIYLKLRDTYPNAVLLESADYHGNENSYSYVGCSPLATIALNGSQLQTRWPDGTQDVNTLTAGGLVDTIQAFAGSFTIETEHNFPFASSGLFGYMAYDALTWLGGPELDQHKPGLDQVATVHYQVCGIVIVMNHFKNEMFLFHHQTVDDDSPNLLDAIEAHINNGTAPQYTFEVTGPEKSNITDEAFLSALAAAKNHCQLGNVFQMVVSRPFETPFYGDDFNVYRALRSINPSPYLFYFDYGNYKIFGSSPETQILVKDGKATIFPIAGTYRRTGHDATDTELAQKLNNDPKENAEHVMLVDLARNDLSRNSRHVAVETFKEIQFYSHVIHLVSKVTGTLEPGVNTMQLVADTFPAGTLSGAPKYKAMQLIDTLEPDRRTYYGGCIGFIDFKGNFNHAIIIRSFLSQNHVLNYRAGAGVVAKSSPENEMEEVNTKLGALRAAIALAANLAQ
jgi:anthranilate synthase component I